MSGFECPRCGSPGVTLPKSLTLGSLIRCSRCTTGLGTWAEFKSTMEAIIAAEGEGRKQPVFNAAPSCSVSKDELRRGFLHVDDLSSENDS